jgi:cytochrome P450
MEMVASDVLLDPAFAVPAVPGAPAGVGWIRCMVPRFCEGEAHARRRALAQRVIAQIGRPRRLSSPTATLLDAMGLSLSLEPDVSAVAQAYQPHVPVPPEANAAADRLVAACGGRTEESAARVCVLVQGHAATLALIARLEAGDGGSAVPVTRRVAPDGHEVLVDLAGAPFGAGRHACPGQALALYLVGAGHQ